MNPELMNLEELSEYIGKAKRTVYNSTHRLAIPYTKIGKNLVFYKAEIDEWINLGGTRQAAVKIMTAAGRVKKQQGGF